jgi:hypothetical protein
MLITSGVLMQQSLFQDDGLIDQTRTVLNQIRWAALLRQYVCSRTLMGRGLRWTRVSIGSDETADCFDIGTIQR